MINCSNQVAFLIKFFARPLGARLVLKKKLSRRSFKRLAELYTSEVLGLKKREARRVNTTGFNPFTPKSKFVTVSIRHLNSYTVTDSCAFERHERRTMLIEIG